MKKRVLSLLMAVALCFATVPMTAFAQEADITTEQKATDTESAVETVAETTLEPQRDVAVYEADISDEGITDISGGNAVAQDTEKAAEVKMVQADQIHDDEADHGIGDVPYWIGVDGLYQIKMPGYYCLTSDVELSSTCYLSAANVVLCLNGHSITLNHDGDVICPGVNFTLCDCKGTGVITHGEDSDGNKYTGSGVSAYFGFRMTGGKITGNTAENNGSGVCIYYNDGNSGFIMTGGEITGNNTSQNGGGVYVDEGTNVKISGAAKITGNYANGTLQDGVYVQGDGTVNNVYLPGSTTIEIADKLTGVKNIGVTLQNLPSEESKVVFARADTGVTLTEDDAAAFFADASDKYGVTYNSADNTLSLGVKHHEHPICGEICTHKNADGTFAHESVRWTDVSDLAQITTAGNYFLTKDIDLTNTWTPDDGVVLDLNGHTISKETKANSLPEAIVVYSSSNFTMTDCTGTGKITHKDGSAGRGVRVHGTFTMYGGTITGNEDYTGAGVCTSGGTFRMLGGKITGNSAANGENRGGGVYINTSGKFLMEGGTITGNTAADTGGGVYVNYDGTMTISGDVKIENNWRDGTWNKDTGIYEQGTGSANNVALNNEKTITIGGTGLSAGAKIGVTTALTPTTEIPIKFATGANDDNLRYSDIFTPDVTNMNYIVVRTGTDLYLTAHKHSWKYELKSGTTDTIVAICDCGADGGSITLTPPEEKTYSGSYLRATVTPSDNWQGSDTNTIDILYGTEDDSGAGEAPINVGTYVASISITGADNKTVTARLKFSIKKATLTITANSNKIIYGDEPSNRGVNIVGAVSDDVKDLWFNYTYDYNQYDNVGDYTITPSAPEGLDLPNYELIFKPGTLTVEQKEVDFIWGNYENRTYGDNAGAIRIEGISYLENNDKISAEITGADLTAGEHTARVTRLLGDKAGNYKLPEDPTCMYTVAKAKQTLKFITSVHDITYDSISFENKFTATSDYHTTVTYESSDLKVVTVDKNGNGRVVGVGTATITATAEADENYESAQATCTVNVAKCPVIISGIKVDDKIYDGNPQTTFHIDSAEVKRGKGMVGEGETACGDVEIDITNAAAIFEDANAGKGKTVTFRGFTLSGNDAGNYELSEQPADTMASITPAAITVTPDAGKEKTYGEKDPDLTYTYSGEIPGENPSFTGVLGRTFGEEAGSYAIKKGTLALQDNGSFKAGNYTLELSDAAVNFTINKAKPVIAVEPKQLVKNGNAVDITNWASFTNEDPEAKLIYELADEYAGITLTGNMLKAAHAASTADSIQIRVTAAATKNFTEPDAKTITVKVVDKTDAKVSITGVPDSKTKTYGDENFILTATSIAADQGTWIWTSTNSDILEIISGADTATPVIKVKKLGEATLTATYSSDGYYGTADVTITVVAKTVTAEMVADIPAQKYTGSAIEPAFEVKDGSTTLIFGTDYEFSYSGNTDAGTATLTIQGRGNYTGTADKTFTILPKSISGAFIVLDRKSFAYNGGEQTATVAVVALDGKTLTTDDYEIKSGNKATDASDSITLTIEGKGNYTGTATTTWEITKINPVLADFDVAPDLTADLTYNGEARIVTVTTKASIRGMGTITVKYNGNTEAPANAGSYAITMDIGEGGNYKAATGIAAGTLTIRRAAAPTLTEIQKSHEYAATGEQTVSTAALVADATGYALGEIPENEILSQVSVSADGTLKYALTGKGAAGSTVAIPVTITSANYEDATVNVVITITKATPTGEPGFDMIHDNSKTLADAGLELINSTLNPKEGTLEWIDSEGKVLPGDTKMEEGRKYIWRFTPADPNYGILTGEVELYAPYRIIDGVDSSWTQDTSGSIAIRGNGAFSKFLNVKVDGVVIDASNYTVTEGSTIITLKADYLKTLAEGSHTFEIVWTDGSAGTRFTVATNTSDDDGSDDNAGNNDIAGSNSASNNNTVPGQVTSPKTGDASGIWTTLFMVSIAGLAAMLARRKK